MIISFSSCVNYRDRPVFELILYRTANKGHYRQMAGLFNWGHNWIISSMNCSEPVQCYYVKFIWFLWVAPPWSSCSVLDHISLAPVFESRRGHIWRSFHLWLRYITFGGRSAHLAYHVHKSGCRTPIIIKFIVF